MISNEGREASIAELIQLMQDPDYKPYINKENILKEWVRVRGFNATDIINSDGQAQQIKQQMQEEASAMAQAKNVPTLRAETSRPDALLEMLQNTDPASPIYPAIYEEVALSQDAMTPSMKAAIDLIKMQLLSGISEEQEASLNELATKASLNPKTSNKPVATPKLPHSQCSSKGNHSKWDSLGRLSKCNKKAFRVNHRQPKGLKTKCLQKSRRFLKS